MKSGNVHRCRRLPQAVWALAVGLLAACVAPTDDLAGLLDRPPIDRAVLVTGGAFLLPSLSEGSTFAGPGTARGEEAIPIEALRDVLERGAVFQRVAVDPEAGNRRRLRDRLRAGGGDQEMLQFLQQARDDGFDLLMVVEELQDGPIERQGTNGRWPVTLATWILLGVGMLIPDRTFESRATLRVTLRELQMGGTMHDPVLDAGPIELTLVERTDAFGLISSILVPPFWVADDAATVEREVRETTTRRLLLRLARDLKSESVRQRLHERAAARIELVERREGGFQVAVDAPESVTIARLRAEQDSAGATFPEFEQALLGSMTKRGERYHYAATLPPVVAGQRIQVLVGTVRGGVASATFVPGERR